MNEDSEMGGAEAMAVMDAVMPHYSEDTPTHTPANQVGHAHSHSSQSGGTRPLTLQPIRWDTPAHTPANHVGHAHSHSSQSGGTRPLTLQPIRWDTPTHTPADQVGHAHSHSSQSGGTRPLTLQQTGGTRPLTLQPIRWDTPIHTPVNQLGHASQSGGARPFTLQSTVGILALQPIRYRRIRLFYTTVNSWQTLTLQPIRWDTPFLRYSQQLGHSRSKKSGGARLFTLQLTVGTPIVAK
jgi:hypothetical protein